MKAVLAVATALMIAAFAPAEPGLAQEHQWRHATTMGVEPKYPEGFTHFDYVNPDAPKGGLLRLGAMGGFDTFNPFLPQGEPATGLGLIYETLTTSSLDENQMVDYGLLAEAISYPDDFSSVTYRLNPDARWHDGEPVTAEDVIWSFQSLVEVNPDRAQYYANVTGVEETAPGEVTFTFDQAGNRELPKIVGSLIVLPKHWWEGTDANGNKRDIRRSTLEPPLGSGPYRIESFEAGRTITYERVPDYWGIDHPTQIGQNNFDEIRYEFFLDLTVQFEAFKGDQIDAWPENQARRWATAYDIPAVHDGRIIKEEFPQDYAGNGVMVGFIYNLREEKFQDPLVREALNYAFNFEELNRTQFFGLYERINSFFFGIDELTSKGLPEGEELEILESVRDQVPPEVFTQPYENPVSGDAAALRQNLRTALNLLTEAGYTLNGTQLVNANGEQLAFEILLNGPTVEHVAQNLVNNLAQIGVAATIRTVDSPQWVNRVRSFDYDVLYQAWAQSASPGNEQRFFFGSASANEEGSSNYSGLADPGVDALIDKVIFADDRETLEAATRALDRVLLAHHILIPSYTRGTSWLARWDRFGRPEKLPEYSSGFPTIWWYDEEKAARTGGAR